jgi:hypothetical protein
MGGEVSAGALSGDVGIKGAVDQAGGLGGLAVLAEGGVLAGVSPMEALEEAADGVGFVVGVGHEGVTATRSRVLLVELSMPWTMARAVASVMRVWTWSRYS